MAKYLAIALCAAMAASGQAANLDEVSKDIVGAWRLQFTDPEGVARTPLVIVGRQRDELAAWYVEKDEPEAFQSAKLVGESLQLTIKPKSHYGDVTVSLTATLSAEGKCQGDAQYKTTSGETGSWKFTGKRMANWEFDELTTWNLSFVTPEQVRETATVTVVAKDGRHYGWYSSKDYELPAKSFTLAGDSVTMVIAGKLQTGEPVEVTFKGTMVGDQVKGDAQYKVGDETGSFPFTASRKS